MRYINADNIINSSDVKVSIITGYYNRSQNLLESINSVLNQTYENIEYIVFDDCSTDGTREILESIDDPKFTLIKHSVNLGFTKGMIHAISRAQGDFIAVHGAGDISLPDRIEKQVQQLNSDTGIGIVGCLIEDVYENQVETVSPVSKTGGFNFSHGEVMYRKELYFKAGGYNPLFKYGQFTMLKFEMLKYAKAGFVNEILYRRVHYKNGVTKNVRKRLEQLLNIHLGINISKRGFWDTDISTLVVALSFQNISLIKDGSQDEKRLKFHLKNKGIHYLVLYILYKIDLLPAFFIRKCGSYLRKKKNI